MAPVHRARRGCGPGEGRESMRLEAIQQALREVNLDGWLFCDHHQRDPLAYRILGLSPARSVTRRWYYLVPVEGPPRGLVHRVEPDVLAGLPGTYRQYAGWREMEEGLRGLLCGVRSVAMQYSPNCALPQVSLVDAGTLELVRGLGVEVASSADLIQIFEARLTPEQLASHLEAGRRVDAIRREAFQWIGQQLKAGVALTEYAVKQHILERLARADLVTDSGPIVASGPNSARPHYEPNESRDRKIRPGDVLLVDLWAKLDRPDAVYYDVTWVGYCGAVAPSVLEQVFAEVIAARDRVLEFLRDRLSQGQAVQGFEADDVARNYIASRGYGSYFIHRTGHSIGTEVHGAGANLDNFETHDQRRLISWTCFSVEPGIYLDEFGVRSEVNVFIDEAGAKVTGEVQTELVMI